MVTLFLNMSFPSFPLYLCQRLKYLPKLCWLHLFFLFKKSLEWWERSSMWIMRKCVTSTILGVDKGANKQIRWGSAESHVYLL